MMETLFWVKMIPIACAVSLLCEAAAVKLV